MVKNKKYYQNILLETIKPLKNYYSESKSELILGYPFALYGEKTGNMEGFSRVLWGLVPFFAGGGVDDDFLSIYNAGFKNGTDKSKDSYWGNLSNKNQLMVEMAAIGYSILMQPDKFWDKLDEETQNNLAQWLYQINLYELAQNNWQYFNVIVNIALKSVGKKYNIEVMEKSMAMYESFYIGNGWYSDGKRPQKDYYTSFAIHYYSMIYAKFEKENDPKRAKIFIQRAKEFSKSFIYWFDNEGKALPFGRSMTYRFAQVSFFSLCALLEIDVLPLGQLKGIIFRNLDFWYSKPIFDNSRILTVGYTYPNMFISEEYNGSGSPYWALKAFAFLGIPDENPFWNCEVLPMPKLDDIKSIPECDMIIKRGIDNTIAITSGQYPVMPHLSSAEKYAKFAYSTKFGFNISRSYLRLEEIGLDSMLTFNIFNMFYIRRKCIEHKIYSNYIYSKWSPIEGIIVETNLYVLTDGFKREHKIVSEFECYAYDGGFPYPIDDKTVKREEMDNKACIVDKKGYSLIESESGTGVIINSVPNLNLVFPLTATPVIKYQINKGENYFESFIKSK